MRKLSEQSLGNVALFYLRRYSASRKGLTRVLERKVKRHVREKGGELEPAQILIEKVVARMVSAGYAASSCARRASSRSWRRSLLAPRPSRSWKQRGPWCGRRSWASIPRGARRTSRC